MSWLDTAPGTADFQAGGYFTPELFADQWLHYYNEEAVVPQIASRNYVGQIEKQGSVVHIPALPDITVEDHSVGEPWGQYPEIEEDGVDLPVEYAKKWKFAIGAILRAQSHLDYEALLKKAAEAMERSVDRTVFAILPGQAHALNAGATAGAESGSFNMGVAGAPFALTPDNIMDWMEDCASVLDEAKVPRDGQRWIVIPSLVLNRLGKSELRNSSFSGLDRSTFLTKRFVGTHAGFNVFQSPNLLQATPGAVREWNVPFGHKPAFTFVTQLLHESVIKAAQSEQYIGDLYRGLQVFGFKATVAEGIGLSVVKAG